MSRNVAFARLVRVGSLWSLAARRASSQATSLRVTVVPTMSSTPCAEVGHYRKDRGPM